MGRSGGAGAPFEALPVARGGAIVERYDEGPIRDAIAGALELRLSAVLG